MIRFCVDYRKLNAIIKMDSYLLSRVDNIFDRLSESSWYSTLDLKSGYWQVKIQPKKTERKLSFRSEMGYGSLGLCHSICVLPRRSRE